MRAFGSHPHAGLAVVGMVREKKVPSLKDFHLEMLMSVNHTELSTFVRATTNSGSASTDPWCEAHWYL